jgi:UDP-2-acetamido-3-amino-2,3-dideoxy-glucuronate N-acetyltransferase
MVANVAVVGCGYWGSKIVRVVGELGALACVVDADLAKADALARPHGARGRTLTEALADPTIEGVAIATPAATHAEIAGAALAAGKHCFVEKPITLRVAEAEALVAAAERAGRKLMVGHLLQYHPAFVELLRLVRAGELGRLQYIGSNRMNFGRFRREENSLWSFAPHDISMLLALAGEEPVSVAAFGAPVLHPTIADVTTTHLVFPSGVKAHVHVSWLHPVKEQTLTVVGERGMLVFNDGQNWDRKLMRYAHRIEWIDGHPQPVPAEPTPVALTPAEPLKLELQHFLRCVNEPDFLPCTDGAEGTRVLRVLAAADIALVGAGAAPEPARPAAQPFFAHETACVDPPSKIGAGTKIWHFSHILPNTEIGEKCVIGQNVTIGPDVKIGKRCKIQNNVSVYKGVTIEDGVFCGPSMVFTNVNNPRAEIERKTEYRLTLVKRGATIGANATILCGTTLGRYCFVGAGTVVTRDVPDFALVVGSPARRIGWMSKAGMRLDADLVCPHDGSRYREVDGTLVEAD